MGHINFAQFMIDRKGITDRVTLNGMTLMNWETTLIPMDEAFIAGLANIPVNRMMVASHPVLLSALSSWKKQAMFISI